MEHAEEQRQGRAATINVGDPERWLSVVAGAALTAFGLTRRSTTGVALAAIGGGLLYRGAIGNCPVYSAMGISTADGSASHTSVRYGRGIRVEKSVTIAATPAALFTFWRDFENLPRFMQHLQSVTIVDRKHSHWIVKGPAKTLVEWDAEVINEVPNELIGWRSTEGAQVDHAGSVHFSGINGGQATELRVILRYDPPGGTFGAAVARLFGEDPASQVEDDLQRLKQLFESGQATRGNAQQSAGLA